MLYTAPLPVLRLHFRKLYRTTAITATQPNLRGNWRICVPSHYKFTGALLPYFKLLLGAYRHAYIHTYADIGNIGIKPDQISRVSHTYTYIREYIQYAQGYVNNVAVLMVVNKRYENYICKTMEKFMKTLSPKSIEAPSMYLHSYLLDFNCLCIAYKCFQL